MKHIRWIWRFWQPHRKWLYVLAGLTLLSAAVTLAYPMVLGMIIDGLKEALAGGDPQRARERTNQLIIILAAIGLARSLANLYPGARAMLNAKLEMGIREYYFARILEKDHRFFQRFRTGDLVTRLTDDIGGFPKIAWFCCSGIFRAVESSSKFVFSLTFMALMNWQLALLAITPLPIMLLLFYKLRSEMRRRALLRQEIISDTNDRLEAAFSGIRILKAFNGEANQATQFRSLLGNRIDVELGVTKLWMGMHNMYFAIQFVGQIIVVVAGGMMVIEGRLTIGELYAFYVYLSILLQPLMDIPNLFVTSRQAFACIDREIEIEEFGQPAGGTGTPSSVGANLASARNTGAHKVPPYEVQTPAPPRWELPAITALELRDVSFRYEDGAVPALSGVSLSLRAGQRAAIVGAVGSGKSTLLKVAAGILPPQHGSVLVNGQPLASYDLAQWRARVGYIPQESNLFSETVLENVRFGRDIPEERLVSALEAAQVRAEMDALPAGLQQVLGQRGLTVSGGQKQRLAIARALAGSPDLLLMDDVTAALDAENERRFWEVVAAELPQAMCLIVTHRLATARQADLIYMLEDGVVVGQGSHSELVASCEPYRSFLSREELAAAVGEL